MSHAPAVVSLSSSRTPIAIALLTMLVAVPAAAQSSLRGWGYVQFDSSWTEPYPAIPIAKLAAGATHTAALRADGSVVLWGQGSNNPLAFWQPPALPAGMHYVDVWGGWNCSIALRSDGALAGWGQSSFLLQPGPGFTWVNAAAGLAHGLALRSDGNVFGWGVVYNGETTPPPLPAGLTYVRFEGGNSFSLGLRSDGTVIGFGLNGQGQCNVPPLPAGLTYVDVRAGGAFAVARRSDGSVVAWGSNTFGECVVPPLPAGLTYVEIDARYQHAIARRSDGSVVAWGNNTNGECVVPPLPAGLTWVGVAAGGGMGHGGFSFARRSDGAVVGWGTDLGQRNMQAPLGTSYVQAATGGSLRLAVRYSDGSVYAQDSGDAPSLPPGTRYVEVAVGARHALARRDDGAVVAWGSNVYGECNVPALAPGVTFVEIAGGGSSLGFSVARTSDGSARAWGHGSYGQTIVPPLPSGVTYTAIAAGANHTLACRSDGTCVAFGLNNHGQTSVPALTPGVRFVDVAGGDMHSLALCSDGNIVGWGRNDRGQCVAPALPPGVYYVEVAAAAFDPSTSMGSSAARRSDGQIVQWGNATSTPAPSVPALEPHLGYVEADMFVGRVASRSSFTRIGTGCAGSRPAAPLVPSDTPRLGTTMQVLVRELPANAAFLMVGFDTTTSPFGPLPLALGALGMPGCTAYVAPEAVHFLLGTNNEAAWSLAIPNDQGLVGLVFHAQAVVLDPAAGNSLGAVMSDAMRAQVGGN